MESDARGQAKSSRIIGARVRNTIVGIRKSQAEPDREIVKTQTRTYIDTSQTAGTSFIQESSFVRNPLNSRLGPRPTYLTSNGKAAGSLKDVPLEIQEALILEDLLSVLMGIPGNYITQGPENNGRRKYLLGVVFVPTPSLDPSLQDMLERILPLATYYTAITAFVESRNHNDYGLVNHALCAALRDMLKDYLSLLAQLEHSFESSSTFSLQKLWFYVHPTLHSLSIIYALISELIFVEEPEEDSDSGSDEEDSEEEARKRALGLGGLKSVIKNLLSPSLGLVKGGEVVAIVWERMRNNSGDPVASSLYKTLLHCSSLPFLRILERWTRIGHLEDPFEEAMIKETRSINRGTLEMDFIDEYWEKRYTLRDGSSSLTTAGQRSEPGMPPTRKSTGKLPAGACIPSVLESWKHKILLAGKYVNVIRECGVVIKRPGGQGSNDAWLIDNDRFYNEIDDAYTYANRALLKLLVNDQDLLPRLRAMKQYFFLSQSSFLTHFMELAGSELRKSPKNASLVKLQSLLDLALNMNFSGEEVGFRYRETVKVSLTSTGLYDWLLKIVSLGGANGFDEGMGEGDGIDSVAKRDKDKRLTAFEVLQLDVEVPFPLSLVLSRKTVLRYQLLFRFLTHLKHIEQCLSQMWIDQKSAPWRASALWHPDLVNWRRRVAVLRARMLTVIQQLTAYVTMEVLEPNWRVLEVKVGSATTVDQLLRDHVDFLDTCLKESMLTNARILKIHSKLFHTCLTFSQYSSQFNKSASQVLEAHERGVSDSEDQRLSMDKRWSFLAKFEQNFNHYVKLHHDIVQYLATSETTTLLALVVRLNSARSMRM